jgi:A/G-specific adenine glycosylase
MITGVSDTLLSWYSLNARKLPWRETRNPYHIWVSEVILQQTRVDQGIEYYHRFIEKFPTPDVLAASPIDEVLKVWQGLGYYSRARNLHEAAIDLVARFEGRMPAEVNDLRSLKGVGEYTACAIASICFSVPVAVVDGNVKRVISRLYGITTPVDSNAGHLEVRARTEELLDSRDPGTFNQAMMEFGALVCTPSKPSCSDCVLQRKCAAFRTDPMGFPVRSKKAARKQRYINYLVFKFIQGDIRCTVIRQRLEKDIWRQLFDFPSIEAGRPVDAGWVKTQMELNGMTAGVEAGISFSASMKHVLTHQDIHASFWEIWIGGLGGWMMDSPYKVVPVSTIRLYALPRLIEKYLDGLQ